MLYLHMLKALLIDKMPEDGAYEYGHGFDRSSKAHVLQMASSGSSLHQLLTTLKWH